MPRAYSPQPAKCKAVEDGERCTRRVNCRGYCNIHYGRMSRHGSTEKRPPGKPKQAPTRCTTTDCKRLTYAKGLCGLHYARMYHHGTLERLKPIKRGRPGATCNAVENGKACPRPYYCSDYCEMHYDRMRRHGTTEKLRRQPRTRLPRVTLGNAEWRSLKKEPTYQEEWTAGLDELFSMYGLHYVPNRFAAASEF